MEISLKLGNVERVLSSDLPDLAIKGARAAARFVRRQLEAVPRLADAVEKLTAEVEATRTATPRLRSG